MTDRALTPSMLTSADLHHAINQARLAVDTGVPLEEPVGLMAHALVQLHARLVSEDVLVSGDRVRLSVALLRDLYDRPDHESVTVEFLRAQQDGPARVVVLRQAQGVTP